MQFFAHRPFQITALVCEFEIVQMLLATKAARQKMIHRRVVWRIPVGNIERHRLSANVAEVSVPKPKRLFLPLHRASVTFGFIHETPSFRQTTSATPPSTRP